MSRGGKLRGEIRGAQGEMTCAKDVDSVATQKVPDVAKDLEAREHSYNLEAEAKAKYVDVREGGSRGSEQKKRRCALQTSC